MVNLFLEILTMGGEKAEAAGGEASSPGAEPAVSNAADAQREPAAAPAISEAAAAPKHESTQASEPEHKPDLQGPEATAAACDQAKTEAKHIPGKVIVIPSGDRGWDSARGRDSSAGERQEIFAKRRFALMAAMLLLATSAGAFGGALATAMLLQGTEGGGSNPLLGITVARIDADILALKAGFENSSKLGLSQFNKTSDRLDKIERAQVEPALKLARLSEAVDKLRAAPVQLPVPVAAAPAPTRDVTGSVSPASPPAAPKTENSKSDTSKIDTAKTDTAKTDTSKAETPKTDVGKLPTLEGWVLRDVVHGGALIDGRRGMYEVYAGDFIPGIGRIDAIRRQDGRWVVVTSKGLIVAR
jgi:hypothetical protein